MMSKNELKANHNRAAESPLAEIVGKYDVKERIESKSQRFEYRHAFEDSWQI